MIASYSKEKGYYSDTFSADLLPILAKVISFEKFGKAYIKARPDNNKHAHWPQQTDSTAFYKDYGKKGGYLESQRADRLIKKTMEKWRARISLDETSLVHRLGLDSALFNKNFGIQSYPHILSLKDLNEALPKPERP